MNHFYIEQVKVEMNQTRPKQILETARQQDNYNHYMTILRAMPNVK